MHVWCVPAALDNAFRSIMSFVIALILLHRQETQQTHPHPKVSIPFLARWPFLRLITFVAGVDICSEVQKTEDDAVPLPDPFPLPKHYQRNVEEALKSGKMLMKEGRMFLSDIASAMLRYKRYPSRDEYVSVSCAVIQAYPFLKSTSGRPYVSCYTCRFQYCLFPSF